MSIKKRIDAITHLTPERLKEVLPAPKSVKIELTGRCNFRCSFCASNDQLRDKAEMPMELFERLVDEMVEAGVEELGLFYLGEPFIDKRLSKAVRYAKEAGIPYVFLTTNGSMATPERVREVIEAGLDSLKFSVNYADADQFVEIAQVKPVLFDKMILNIMSARDVRDEVEHETWHRCGLYGSFILYDGEQGRKMADLAEILHDHLDDLYALPLYGQAGPQASPSEAAGMVPVGGNTGRAYNPVDPVPCWSVFAEGHITWEGKMSACCWDHTDGLSMGDLNEVSFMDAWNSPKFQALRKFHLSGNVIGSTCEACIYG